MDGHHRRHRRAHAPRYTAMLDFLQGESVTSILDVGVEPYIFTEMVTQKFGENVELYGIAYGEHNESWTKDVNDREIEVRSCNIETDQWPYEQNSQSRVVMGAIIEHLFDPLSALQEARRVLNHEGRLILSTPNAVRLSARLKTLIGINPYDGFPLESKYNRHNHEWTQGEIYDILDVAGFNIEDEVYVKIDRRGPKRFVNIGARLHPSLADQMVFKCSPAEPTDRQPKVYRQGLTE